MMTDRDARGPSFPFATLLAPLVFLLYAGTLGNSPVWDDQAFIGGWPEARSFEHLPDMLLGATPPGHGGVYRPLRGVLAIVDHALFGGNFILYRLQAILVHLACTLLLYALTLRIAAPPALAALTAFLFGVHPVHVESITFTTSSLDTVGAVFFVAALVCHVEAGRRERPLPWNVLAAVCGAAAFLTDELTLCLPLVIVLLETTVVPRDRRRPATALPWCGAAAALLLVRFALFHIGVRGRYLGGGLVPHALAAVKAFALSVGLTLVPVSLTVDHTISPGIEAFAQHDASVLAQAWTDPPVLGALTLIATLAGTALFCRAREPLVTFAIGWIVVCLLPAANLLPQAALMRERYLYLPSYGGCLLVATAACRAWQAAGRVGRVGCIVSRMAVAAAVVGGAWFCMESTLRLNRVWRDEAALWEHMAAANPRSGLICFNLGVVRESEGRTGEALRAYEAAVRGNPRSAPALVNLGGLYCGRNRDDEAASLFRRALAIQPDNALAHYNLGVIHARHGRTDNAVAAYRRAIACRPDFLAAYYNLGAACLAQKRWSEAAEAYERALRRCGPLPAIKAGLTQAYRALTDEAKAAASRSAAGGPKTPRSRSVDRAIRGGLD